MLGWTGALRRKTYRAPDGDRGAQAQSETGVMSGLVSGTMVATALGWRDVSGLQAGDLVLTFDNGLQPVRRITTTRLWGGQGPCPTAFWPLSVPAGVLGNDAPITLLPRQGVMLESDIAEQRYGDPFALIPAASLEGAHGIERAFPNDEMSIVMLHFEDAQVVFGAQGTLLFCPAADNLLEHAVAETRSDAPAYEMLPEGVASDLLNAERPLCA